MNFLAHMFLSCSDENLMIGNFIADFVPFKDLETLHEDFKQGIELHKKIDSFTDAHPMFKQGVIRLRKRHRKYAPVVLDILYDYLLAHHWQLYSGEALEDFIQDRYHILEKRLIDLPASIQFKIPLMIADNFLHQYTSYLGLSRAMRRMDKRTRFPSAFTESIDDLKENFDEFSEEFNRLFPDLISHVDQICAC